MRIQSEPEFLSVAAFAGYLADEERGSYTVEELGKLNASTHMTQAELRKKLGELGFELELREVPKAPVRGFTANSHDRFTGPGSGN